MQRRTSFYALFASVVFCTYAAGQTQPFGTPHPQIVQRIDESATVTLAGNVHPLARALSSSAPADLGTSMAHMVLSLKGSAAQEAGLTQLIAAQNNPKSALYHQYLTPQSFASQFGAAPSDIAKVSAWLESHGMHVEQVPAGNRALIFSGTAVQVNDAFQTEIRQYKVAGESHYANATDPKIPAALAGAIGGVVKLHDFRHTSNISMRKALRADPTSPQYTNGSTHYVTPADYSIIYDINPLYTAGINGTGETIAVIARSDIYLSDVQTFRSTFGLKANNPQFIVTNSDPGVLSGDSVETTLDTEWSGAVAPGAAIKVIISSSGTSDGIDLSSLYAVNNNVAPIITLSYGSCEVGMGASELSFYNSLWKQAASQGQSVMVSSGDSGAAGCDNPGASSVAQYGQNINGLCSSPYSTCVGGTEFADTSNPGQYWLPANNATYGSALSYIPEGVWNESGKVSGGSGIWAGGGGASLAYAKPSWQTGPGVPTDGKRDVPDVSLTAASHDGYFIALYGTYYSVGGTSAAAPAFAGMVALVDQKMNARQGLLNSILYPLAIKQASGGAAVFHDITAGNNSVPGVTGFAATAGYDLASGLGTIDANLLVNHWTDGAITASSLSLTASSQSLSVVAGQSAQTTITSTASASLKAAVALTVTGAPAGLTATLASATIASPGSGTDVLNVAAASTLAGGTYNLTVAGIGGGQTATVPITVVVPAPSFALSRSTTSLSVTAGNSGSVNLSIAAQSGFSSAVALAVAGLPTGVTAAFTPTSITGTTVSVLKLTVASTASASTSTLTITGASGSLKATTSLSLAVLVPGFTLSPSAASLSVTTGNAASVNISAPPQNGFNSAVALSVSGLPTGVSASFTPSSITGTTASALKLTVASTAPASTSTLTITGTNGSLKATTTVSLVVSAPSLALTASVASLTAPAASSETLTVSATQSGLSSPVALSVTGLPAGVTATFSPATLSVSGSSTLKLTTASTVIAGTYPLTITATGGGLTSKAAVSLVIPSSTFTLTPSSPAISVTQGKTGQLTVSITPQNGFNSTVSLSVSGLPPGVTGVFSSPMVSGNPGASPLTLTVPATTGAGSYLLTISATGGAVTKTASVTLVVDPIPTCVAASSPASVTLHAGLSSTLQMSCSSPTGSFSGPLAVTVTGAPAGMTAQLSAATLTPGSTVSLNISTVVPLAGGTYNLAYNVSGSGYNKTLTIPVTVLAQNILTLNASQMQLNVRPGASSQVTLTTTALGSFNNAIAFTTTLPTTTSGLTASLSKTSLPAPGSGTVVVTINAASNVPSGNYVVQVTAIGGTCNESVYLGVEISSGPGFSFSVNTTALTIAQGKSGSFTTSNGNYTGGFNGQMSVSMSGFPSGANYGVTGANTNNNMVNITYGITLSSFTPAGTYPITISATGSGITHSVMVQLTVVK